MGWVIVAALVGVSVLVLVARGARAHGRRGNVPVRLLSTSLVLGLAAWALMLAAPVNDAVLGDLPRELSDFTRMCEHDGGDSDRAFPRAAAYTPGHGTRPWVAVEDAYPEHSARGAGAEAPEPRPDRVELVACGERSGEVDGTEKGCDYTVGLGQEAVFTTTYAQSRYRVSVFEARTGERVGGGTIKGRAVTECPASISAGREDLSAAEDAQDSGSAGMETPVPVEPEYSGTEQEAYAHLLAGLDTPRSR